MVEGSYDLAGFSDVPAYIYGITRAIWEDRGLGPRIRDYYAEDVRVRTQSGLTIGADAVTRQTVATLHEFPDRQLVGEDVIWTQTADRGFLSSHRLMSLMTHSRDGIYGRASDRRVRARAIADCWVQDGQVKEEWLVRDGAAIARSLGATAEEIARKLIDEETRNASDVTSLTPSQNHSSRYKPDISQDPVILDYVDTLERVWNNSAIALLQKMYFAGATLYSPGGDICYGIGEIDQLILGYLASFPGALFRVDSATIMREVDQPVRVAIRWSLEGIHAGFGRFGRPTGAPVYIMGISHAHLTGGKIRAEWLVVDEVAVWKQILGLQAATGQIEGR